MHYSKRSSDLIVLECLITSLRDTIEKLQQLERKLVAVRDCEVEGWITAPQFALLTQLTAKTVANYCGSRRIEKCRKKENGEWLIHVSEIEKHKK